MPAGHCIFRLPPPPNSSHSESEGDRSWDGAKGPRGWRRGDREGQGRRERHMKTEKDGGPRRTFVPSRGAD